MKFLAGLIEGLHYTIGIRTPPPEQLRTIAIVWLVSPIDLIPEFIPVAGPLDDAIVAALVLRYVLRHTDRSVLEAHWRGGGTTLDVLAGRS